MTMILNSSSSSLAPLKSPVTGNNKKNVNYISDIHSNDNGQLSQPARSDIVDFYSNRSVLITGGSGFIGKVMIEKLLRTCPKVKHIFVLIRPKWNKSPEERLQELLKAPLFDGVRSACIEQKVVVVEGDVTQPNLGLSEQSLLRIMNEVSVIYHSAATVKFDEPLKQSVAINIAGTKNMIDVCRKIPQLAALVHVSTAYANCDRDEVDEHIYPVDTDPEKLIELANWLDQDTMQELKMRLLAKRPNTYTYTKALAEWLLIKCARDLPIVVCRPSIVVASWREPFSGWIDNVNGPTGIILGAGKGLIRSMFANPDCVADLVPVDTVINLIITLGWFAHVYRHHKQLNDSAESLSESLIGSGSSSGDESFEGFTERINHSLTSNKELAVDSRNGNQDDESNSDNQQNNNNNNNIINNDNNNNGNDESIGEYHSSASPYDLNEGNVTRLIRGSVSNTIPLIEQRYLDDGYISIVPSPDTKSTASSSSKSSSSNKKSSKLYSSKNNSNYISNNNNNNNQHHNATSIISETPDDMRDNLKLDNNDPEHRVLTFVAQRRLAEQRHAAFEYKLKQFRHNIQVKLAAQNLPEEIADIPVFHCTSGAQNPITWGRMSVLILTILALFPSGSTYRYPRGSFTHKKYLDDFYRITLHYIPGYIVDFITKLFGGKPVLVKIFKKFDQAANVLKAFTTNEWNFDSDNRLMLINELMSKEDKRLFDCDLKALDWEQFLIGYVLGVRQFLLKEDPNTLNEARSKLRVVYYRNLSLQVLFVALIAYCFFPTSLITI